MIAKALKEDVKKTRWGFIGGLALGTLAGIALLMWFLIFLMQSQHQPVQQAAATTPEVHYFDYAKIVGAIRPDYFVLEKSGDEEVWSTSTKASERASVIVLVGAPNKVTKIQVMFPSHDSKEHMTINSNAIRQLSIALTGDTLAEIWTASAIVAQVEQRTASFNGAKVYFNEVTGPNGSIFFLTFTPQ